MKLIYEKSQAGRRGLGVPRPDLPVPAVPAELARKEPARLPELAEPEVLRHFTALSTRNFGIDTGFYPLGSCTMKYNPRVNERVVGAARLPRPASARRGRRGAGRARARVGAPGDPARGDGPRRSVAPACGRQPGRADRADAHARVLRGRAGRTRAPQDRDPGHSARHEPRERDDGRLRADAGEDRRAREHRRRGSARQGRRAHGRADADEPVDARAVRREHRGDPRHLPRRRRAHVLRRREPERRLRDLASRRHGLRHRPHQPAQDVLAAARRRRSRRRPDRRAQEPRAVPAGAGRRARTATRSGSTTTGRSRSGRCARSPGRSAFSSARMHSSAPRGRPCAR